MPSNKQLEPDANSVNIIYKIPISLPPIGSSITVMGVEGNPSRRDVSNHVFSSLDHVGAYVCHIQYLADLKNLLDTINRSLKPRGDRTAWGMGKILGRFGGSDGNQPAKKKSITEKVADDVADFIEKFEIPKGMSDEKIILVLAAAAEQYNGFIGNDLRRNEGIAVARDHGFDSFPKLKAFRIDGCGKNDADFDSGMVVLKVVNDPNPAEINKRSLPIPFTRGGKGKTALKALPKPELRSVFIVSKSALPERRTHKISLDFGGASNAMSLDQVKKKIFSNDAFTCSEDFGSVNAEDWKIFETPRDVKKFLDQEVSDLAASTREAKSQLNKMATKSYDGLTFKV